MGGKNIGDLLNAAGVTWGFFEGGFDLSIVNPDGSTGCKRTHTSLVTGVTKADYIPHHQPFQYYASTSNPQHTRPTSVQMIGHNGDAANHQYDTHDFFDAVNAGNFPAVSFLKAAWLSGWPRRLLRSSRRADLHRRHHQLPDEPSGMEKHGRDHSL